MKSKNQKNLILSKDKASVDAFLESLYSRTSKEWKVLEQKKLLSLFKSTISSSVAYKKFIKKNNLDIHSINSFKTFDTVPSVTKNNYLRQYPWQELCKSESITRESLVMTATSGSTGEPFYFPRTERIDLQSSIFHQLFLSSSKINKKKSTLVIDCFGMGVWIGGLITYQAFKYITERGHTMTIITPGINKHEIFQAIKNIGPHYDQIILCGYPPFLKDVIDSAMDNGITFSDFTIKIIFAAEGFSETFRDYLAKKTGIKNIYRDTMNIYGSADLGTMAEESPLCILVRRLAINNKQLYMRLFGQTNRLPTLAQYIPDFVTFESKNGIIYCTGDNALPLIRYEIGDSGTVFTYDELLHMCKDEGIDLTKEIKRVGIQDTITELPFVSIYERSDFSTKLYGAIIYPEYIKKGLQVPQFEDFITGKFTMSTKHDDAHDAYLEVNIELRPGVKETKLLHKNVTLAVSEALTAESTEHKNNVSMLSKSKVEPRIIFWPFENEVHFRVGGKQKWVK